MPRFNPYRRSLTPRAQRLRRDSTPAEHKLWYEFLRLLPEKFTRQKPLGDSVRTGKLASMGIRVIRFTNREVSEAFEGVCFQIRQLLNT